MDISELLDGLNDKQREAVAAPLGNYLVLAGAGSGKTRVLTYRIAWLIAVEQISEGSIMAVTFTNKAAAEMRHRIESTLAKYSSQRILGMWIGTFHSIAHRLLRAHYADAGLPQDFQILDSDDQLRLVKRLIKLHNIDEQAFPPKQACWYINNKKEEGLRPQQIDDNNDRQERTWIKIYQIYQDACDRAGLLDFAELLLRAYELWLKKPLILQRYQQRFSQILVDEFQDTNKIQYAWIKLLVGDTGKIMIVGDDDQSIYGWRGAQVENIHRFLEDFHQAQTIRLEQNYRSTSNILNSANHLIANNSNRLGKELWTEGEQGDPVGIYAAFNEIDEAQFVANQINIWLDEGGKLNDCAILYRSNSQSRVIEEALIRAQIPYRIYGGLRFFERQEIKDALAYLRLIANRFDDAAFERVINTPARGIGDRTLDVLRQLTRERQITLWQAIQVAIQENRLAGRSATALLRFTELINSLQQDTAEMPLFAQTDFVIKHSGLYQMYKQEKGEKGEVRIENLEELVSATREFIKPEDAEEMTDLMAFLTHASLESGEEQASPHQASVQMMTLHSAKGLEFERVFIVGVEEGIFPSARSFEEGRMEEERRLAYVGITRAKQKLTISYAESRRLYGKEERHLPSRFIEELPKECIQEVRLRGTVTRAYNRAAVGALNTSSTQNDSGWKMGQKVKHAKFGNGTIINVEGSDNNTRLQIAFQGEGIKWLIATLANLERIN
ncbi:DNA-dependent helicase II [Avibacterium paragallinarum]|uniref:DNA helicase II n=1 Tax=Avibacterium paragallinarum TaxID=728 RepID=A0A0F5F138_AVIPA|nr:DNA helicase II [Avibacterium paragallinarum]KAA6209182.1 DNA helicase II [Avibacterium paragallinarum]KKB01922.1 DNA-dependent helicase II [Avibacterium paragallinarum]RZN72681.1 DNA helicase II [Avibacterium paragallinarum]TID19310.1 DNA-dependent helicase II [Avibacterium paragallinarum]SUU98549.1 DNA helicase II [Avibacterium paragallinarum]